MPVEHIVVLCLENRSFDHMLGFLDHPAKADFDGLLNGGPFDNAGFRGAPRVAATPGAKKVLPFGPDHSHDAVMLQLGAKGTGPARTVSNDGFVVSYERKCRGMDPARLDGLIGPVLNWWQSGKQKTARKANGCGPLVMLCQSPAHIPALSTLALQFAVCDQWFCSVPGETWPNRNYLHAATSDGETDIEIRGYTNPTIFELIEDHGASWRIYHDDTPQVWAFPALWDTPERHKNWYSFDHFAGHCAAGDLPSYSFIEPNHRPPLHTLDRNPSLGGTPGVSDSQHPENNLVSVAAYEKFDGHATTDFARGDQLIASVYEALRGNPELFAKTMLLITYDEHGGLYDHRPPPTDVPAPGGDRGPGAAALHAIWHRRVQKFDFRMLGPRVPAVVISPLIEPGTVSHQVHDHASVPATLRALFAPGAKPLTKRDAWSPTFHGLATRDTPRTDLPDLSAHVRPKPKAAAAPGAAAPAAAAEPAVTEEQVPGYYQEFIRQSDFVRNKLRQLGEPELETPAPASGFERAIQTSQSFTEAAHRHRHPG
jgi:phospholipase C